MLALPVTAPINEFAVTLPLNVGLLLIVKLVQLPPDPSVITFPPPDRLPLPLAQVSVVLPCTEVFATDP